MRSRLYIPLGILGFILLVSSSASPVVADRIMAVVNKEVIALSDVQKYRELFEERRDTDDAAALSDLIDQKLLLAEAKKLEILPPSDDEIAQAYQKLRRRFGRPETFELLKARLILSDAEIELQIQRRLMIDKLIEQRIRFFVFVTPEEIESYYQGHLDEFRNQTPEAARKAIAGIRTAEKVQLKLKDYIDRLRANADIRINRPPPE